MEIISWWHIYLFGLIEPVLVLAGVGSLIFGVGGFGLMTGTVISASEIDVETTALLKKITTWVSSIFLVLITLYVLVPTQKTVCAMFIVPKVVNNQQVQSAAGDVAVATKDMFIDMSRMPEVLKNYMQAYIKEMGVVPTNKKKHHED